MRKCQFPGCNTKLRTGVKYCHIHRGAGKYLNNSDKSDTGSGIGLAIIIFGALFFLAFVWLIIKTIFNSLLYAGKYVGNDMIRNPATNLIFFGIAILIAIIFVLIYTLLKKFSPKNYAIINTAWFKIGLTVFLIILFIVSIWFSFILFGYLFCMLYLWLASLFKKANK